MVRPAQAAESGRLQTWLDLVIGVAAILSCAISLSANVVDPDLWGHVQYGRDLLADGLPETTTYSFTAEGYRWINHENLAELLLAVGMDVLDATGLLLAKCLLGCGMIVAMIWLARRDGATIAAGGLVAILVATNLSHFWCLRPQLLSYVCFGLLLILLRFTVAGPSASWRPRQLLWASPLLFIVWTNSHGGFVAGYCVFTCYLALRAGELLIQEGRAALPLAGRLVTIAGVAALATLVNPYGLGLHEWMLGSLGIPRPEIVEWLPPDMTSMIALPLWGVIVGIVVSVLFSRRPRDITHLVILAILLWQTLEHARHIPFLAIAFGFWMPAHIDSLLRRLRLVSGDSVILTRLRPTTQRAIAMFVCGWILLMGGKLQHKLSELVVERGYYPVSAVGYIAERGLSGKLVVNYNWAQYVIAAVGGEQAGDPGVRVGFDGRFRTSYPQEIVDMNFDFTLGMLEERYRAPESGPFDDERVLEHGSPDLVLISRLLPHGVNVMFRNSDRWTLLYQDELAQLWGRTSRYGVAPSDEFIPAEQRVLTESPQYGRLAWPALPNRRVGVEKLVSG